MLILSVNFRKTLSLYSLHALVSTPAGDKLPRPRDFIFKGSFIEHHCRNAREKLPRQDANLGAGFKERLPGFIRRSAQLEFMAIQPEGLVALQSAKEFSFRSETPPTGVGGFFNVTSDNPA